MIAAAEAPQQRRNGVASPPADRRKMPHNLELEASILGGIILHNEVLADLQDLETADFYHHPHRVVFEAIRNLQHAGRPIAVATLEYEIESLGKLAAIGGVAFLGELALQVTTADNVLAYRDIVTRDARNRQAILALSSALERAYTWPHDPGELIAEVRGELGRLEDLGAADARRDPLMSIDDALDDLESIARAPVFPTPFETLNEAIGFGGLLGSQVYTVAAPTGRGKTTWVAQLAAHVAEMNVPVLVSVHELGPGYFVARKAAGALSRHSNDILRGQVERDLVHRAMPYAKMKFLKRPTLKVLREQADRVAQQFGQAPLIVVDYLQKLADEIAARMQRPDLRLATNEASEALLDIGDRTGAVIVAVSSIGRGKTALKNPRKFAPFELVEVAKESGAVEYDGAGMIVLTLSDEFDGDDRVGTISLAKARFGSEKHIDGRYNGARGLWRDCGEVMREPGAPNGVVKAVAPPAAPLEEREDVIRANIIETLLKGAARNKTSLVERVKGGRKQTIRAVLALMLDQGVLSETEHGIALSPSGRQLFLGGTQ